MTSNHQVGSSSLSGRAKASLGDGVKIDPGENDCNEAAFPHHLEQIAAVNRLKTRTGATRLLGSHMRQKTRNSGRRNASA